MTTHHTSKLLCSRGRPGHQRSRHIHESGRSIPTCEHFNLTHNLDTRNLQFGCFSYALRLSPRLIASFIFFLFPAYFLHGRQTPHAKCGQTADHTPYAIEQPATSLIRCLITSSSADFVSLCFSAMFLPIAWNRIEGRYRGFPTKDIHFSHQWPPESLQVIITNWQ